MNFVTFVFSLLMIFAFGTFVVMEKKSGDRKLRETYLGHILANRKILSKWESKTYDSFRSKAKDEESKEQKERQISEPEVNPHCAKLNLWSLVHEEKEPQNELYEIAIKLLDAHYGNALFSSPQEKITFLNALIRKAQEAFQTGNFALEKLKMDPKFQLCYYKMLKGTKTWDPENKSTYPPLLDVIKIDEGSSKISICHAHIGQLKALFGEKVGSLIFREIHSENLVTPSKELIEEMYSQCHLLPPKKELYDLLEMERKAHLDKGKSTLIATDKASGVSLRKHIYSSKNLYSKK